MQKTTVLVADDHMAIIEGIKSALADHPEFEVIGECSTGQSALNFLKTRQTDVVILDISMSDISGIEVTKKITALGFNTKIVIYTMHDDAQFVVDLFKSGISAYVLKDDPLTDLIRALEAVKAGGTYFSQMAPMILARHLKELENRKIAKGRVDSLSKREREVFLLLAEGNSIKEIAHQLFISPKTVESHKYNIMDKLQAKSVVELAKIAIRKNLIQI